MPPTSSPLSPRLESLGMTSATRRRPGPHQRQTSSGTAGSLRLPSLPRFHPANFPSQNSSMAATPLSGPNSPQPPLSPRAHQRQQMSEVQRQMYMMQRDMIANANRGSMVNAVNPTSPRLNPMGSPGPVTPLELEGEAGYLTVGATDASNAAAHVDKLIREEARRRGEVPPERPTSVSGR